MWVFDLYSFDHLVLVLETSSNKIPIRINLDPNVPDVNATNPGILIGFGKVGSNAVGDDPVTLQETNITFLDNGECEEVENVETGELIFLDRIKDDMICVVGADGNGSGQCSGDSGGPYLIPSENGDPEGDLQVGLVSWSYGGTCSAEYPAVGARTSVFEWIRLATCQYALTPPEYMNCDDDSITFSPAPTPAPAVPTTSPAPTEAAVSITLSFYFDDEPHEVSWSIFESETEQVMLQRPAFYYPRDIELVRETLLLSPGRYTLTVEDSHGDGINNGEEVAYDVTLTNEATKSKFLLLERAGNFRVKRTETFVVPSVEEYPTESPSAAPSLSIAPTATTVDVYLTIDLDDWYKETGWSIYDANDPSVVFGEVLPGEYTTGGNVTETITLPYPGGDFLFEIEDNFGDGLLEGQGDGYSLWVLDSATGDQIVLVEGSGDFEDGTVHNFTLPELTMG
jgi:Trypsin